MWRPTFCALGRYTFDNNQGKRYPFEIHINIWGCVSELQEIFEDIFGRLPSRAGDLSLTIHTDYSLSSINNT